MRLVATKDMAAIRRSGTARVNEAAGAARGRFITIAAGQEMVYLAKEAEGLRYLAEYPDPFAPATELDGFPFLVAELGITAADPYTLAQVWVQGAALFRQVGSAIETVRLGAVAAIEAAAAPAGVEAAVAAAVAGFAALPSS